MINHLRTCLLNANPASTPPPAFPGEEYVSPAYQPKVLQGDLLIAYQLLFGAGASRSLMNWRLRELMSILHAGELAQFVTALDPRITYLPFKNDLMQAFLAGTVTAPPIGLPDLLFALKSAITPAQEDAVFGPVGTPEPFKTFRNLWERHDQLPYQLGGFTLGLGYQINALGG